MPSRALLNWSRNIVSTIATFALAWSQTYWICSGEEVW